MSSPAPAGRGPTIEQQAAVAAFRTGQHLVLQAGAGSGKTTTLRALARCTTRRGLYLAFNKATATDAKASFPRTVFPSTGHGLAWRAVGHRFGERLNAPRLGSAKLAALLGVAHGQIRIGAHDITDSGLCHVAQQTVLGYCYSSDDTLTAAHVPWPHGITDADLHAQLADIALPLARRMWSDLQTPDRGRVPFKHDHYLKMWALNRPQLRYEFLLLDEAQDTNPVVEQVFTAQRGHAQLVMVGDSAQAIYGWRGARDVMTDFPGTPLTLSRSFRFGPELAAEANRWLAVAGQPLRLTGTPELDTRLQPVPDPDVILCRTNGGAMTEILTLLAAGRRVGLVGSGKPLRALALAARDLKQGRRTVHPELLLFSTWEQVQHYAQDDPDGRDLQPLVDVIDAHGVDVVLDTLNRLTDERHAQVVVSTVHKAKGREWASVRIGDDFPEPEDPDHTDADGDPLPGPIDPGEARLAYVAVTRARHRLDLGGLSWINTHPDGRPAGRGPGPSAAPTLSAAPVAPAPVAPAPPAQR